MRASDIVALWLYIFVIPLVAHGTRDRGASEGMSHLLAIIWPIAYIIGIIATGVRDT